MKVKILVKCAILDSGKKQTLRKHMRICNNKLKNEARGLGKSSKKKRIFYGQAYRKGGGGGSAPPGLTIAFVKILGLKTN